MNLLFKLILLGAMSFSVYGEGRSVRFEFTKIPAGRFIMGSPVDENDRDDDEEQVNVSITRSFAIMPKEVTQEQWFGVMGNNPSHFSERKYCDDHRIVNEIKMCPKNPVENVSWYKVWEFITRLNDKEGSTNCNGTPKSGKGCYRLPTEAEWEYAARAGTMTAYFFGDDRSRVENYAWYYQNAYSQTQKVGLKTPNPWGLYDMYGNVSEWVGDGYAYRLLGGADPLQTKTQKPRRILRGGNWSGDLHYLRSSDRSYDYPGSRRITVGFRLVRTL